MSHGLWRKASLRESWPPSESSRDSRVEYFPSSEGDGRCGGHGDRDEQDVKILRAALTEIRADVVEDVRKGLVRLRRDGFIQCWTGWSCWRAFFPDGQARPGYLKDIQVHGMVGV